MREIKFRVWDKIERKFLTCNFEISAVLSSRQRGEKAVFYPVMQFTGLIDKNGVGIYEGDIVKYKRGVGNWTGKYMTTTHDIVFTEEISAFVMNYGSSYIKLRKHWNYEYEVLGNIYENK